MIKLIVFLVLTSAAYVLWRSWQDTRPEDKRKWWIKAGTFGFLAVIVSLVVTGKIHVLFAAAAAILPYIRRIVPWLRHVPVLKHLWRNRQMFAGGEVKTALIAMSRDETTGKFVGRVISGEYAGQGFERLDEVALKRLYDTARQTSPDSILLLQAYLEQRFGANWRNVLGQSGEQKSANNSGMSVSEAYQVLGVEEGASLKEVLLAYKKMMQKVHPDRGGSHFIAAQVNEAKDVLSRHLS